ncbi:MAG: GNAT family N-acetyltransferase [Methanomassiliicoccales archaeon]|nr:GNAT family N-acetyltransferase [Methanomassiliicoccales archaeon]
MEIEATDDLSTITRDPTEYLRVLASCGEDSVFLTPEWLAAWWKHFGEGRTVRILRAVEDGRAVGFGCLMVSELGSLVKLKKLEFLASGPSDRLGMVAENGREDVTKALVEAVRQDIKWDVAELNDMKEGGPTATQVLAAFEGAEISTEKVPYVPISGDFKSYLAALSQNMRHNMTRTMRRNFDDLSCSFVRHVAPEEIRTGMEDLFKLHGLRWASKGEDSAFTDRAIAFVKEAAAALSKRGVPVVHALVTKDGPTAMSLGFEYNGRYLYYLSGLDPRFSKYGPGRCLLSKIIEEAHTRGLTEVDLLRGEEQYKYQLGAVDRLNVSAKSTRRSLKGLVAGRAA